MTEVTDLAAERVRRAALNSPAKAALIQKINSMTDAQVRAILPILKMIVAKGVPPSPLEVVKTAPGSSGQIPGD